VVADVIMSVMKCAIKNTIIITLLMILLAPMSANASDWSPLGGVVLTVPAVYDQQAGSGATGLDLNMIIAFLNAGISYRHWEKADLGIRGWDGSDISRDETTFYFGVGFLNVIQLQAGYSESGASMRVRSDLVLFSDSFPMLPSAYKDCPKAVDFRECNNIDIPRDGIVLSPFVEFTPSEDNHKTLYGVGLGVVF
jgi:hypothetical protein